MPSPDPFIDYNFELEAWEAAGDSSLDNLDQLSPRERNLVSFTSIQFTSQTGGAHAKLNSYTSAGKFLGKSLAD